MRASPPTFFRVVLVGDDAHIVPSRAHKKIITKTNLKNIKNPTKNKIFVDYSPKWLYNKPMYANKEEKL